MNNSRWRNTENLFFIFVFLFLNTLSAIAGPSRTTYQAKIVKPDGYPLEAPSVNFKFTILDPAGSCILYAETYSSVNMTSTGGLISFALGSGVKTYPVSSTTFEQVFSNITPSLSCDAGGPVSYSPSATDTRKIVMQFHDGSGWQTLPAMAINAVPYAMYANDAQKLNGKLASDFVQVSTVPTCGASEALKYNGSSFSCIAVGSPATSVTSSTVVTALGYTPADGASVSALSSSLTTTNSTVSAVSSSVTAVSSTVNTLAANLAAVSAATNAANANIAALTSDLAAVSSTVNTLANSVATSASVSALSANVASVSSTVYAVSSTVSSLSASVSNLTSTVSGISATVSGLSASMAALVSSQWTTGANGKIYYNNSVGIGTSAPTSSFEITSATNSVAIHLSGADTQGAAVRYFTKRTSFNESLGSANPTGDNNGWSLGSIGSQNAATTRRNNFEASYWNGSAWSVPFVITASGSIGVGTVNPVTRLDVSGGVRIGTESTACSAALAGTLRYNGGAVEYCNGTAWSAFGISGAGLTLLNGSASNTQTFANGTTGTTPAFVTANGIHTLNIPLASTGSVTAGLISNADYVSFSNKITSSAASIAQVLGYTPLDNAVSGSFVLRANNLSDLSNVATARTNLGLGTFATANSVDLGSASATGTLAAARLPSFAGDVTSVSGSNSLTLANSGVTSGTYSKVTVDTKGRVISGAQLTSTDVTTALGYTPGNASGSITLLNGSSSQTQTFANGTTGTTPTFVTANGVHTLNIPLASAASVTGGLLSNADYTTFMGKITSSAASIAQVLGYTPASATSLSNYLVKTNNLSDLTSSASARTNLGLGDFATANSVDLGSASATGIIADARLVNQAGVASGSQYTKVTVDGKGRVISGAQLTSSDVTTALGFTPGAATSGVTSLNGSSSQTQTFANGATGTAPAFVTANGVHTLNIPLASAASVTGGLLSNADYTTFMGKITSSAASISQVLGYTPASATSLSNYLVKTNNLSDLTSSASARTNLGLGTFATANSVDLGSASATGTLDIARLPSFAGDVTSVSGSNALTLVNSGVTSGTYTKVTVDSKGRVTSSSVLNVTDVTTALGYTPASASASTQWTTSGTSVYYNTGNVGIGTGNPADKLHVAGGFLVGSGGVSAGSIGNLNITGSPGSPVGNRLTFGTDSTVWNFRIGKNQAGTITDIVNISQNGGVGIGTTFANIQAPPTNGLIVEGFVGLGTSAPVTRLDVAGGIKISTLAVTCAASYAGAIRYNSGNVEYCNGTAWAAFGVSGAGLQSLNGTTSQTQTFANGTTGTTPAFVTANGVHTLNIPLASAASVTGGLLSNADYTTFMGKITSSAASIAEVLGYTPASATQLTNYLAKANNLSDLTSSATARTNLGLGTLATANSIDLGSASATGTLAAARLPAFAGDATSVSGSNTLTLANSGVTSGTYTKVTVNAKGLVTSGSQLTTADVTTALGYAPVSSSAATQWNTSGTTINYMAGNVGVNISNPSSPLHVQGSATSSSTPWVTFEGGGSTLDNVALRLYDRGTASVNNNSLEFAHIGSGLTPVATARLRSLNSGTYSANGSSLFLETASDASGTWNSNQLVLNRNGNVGIGTSTPAYRLDVSGTSKFSGTSLFGNTPATSGVNFGPTLGLSATYNSPQVIQHTFTDQNSLYMMGLGSSVILDSPTPTAVGTTNFGSFSSIQTKQGNATNYGLAYGAYGYAEHAGSGNADDIAGVGALAIANTSGTVTNIRGVEGRAYVIAGSVTNAHGGEFSIVNQSPSAISYGYGVKINPASGNYSNNFGLYIGDQAMVSATNTYNFLSDGSGRNAFVGVAGFGTTLPVARVHIANGTSSLAPLKFTSGTLLTSPTSGSVEYDGFNLYYTDGTNTRRTIANTTNVAAAVTSSTVTTALGYTPANSSTVNSLSGTVTTLQNSVTSMAAAAWSVSGTSINFSTGNVGIGTSAPAGVLDIAWGGASGLNGGADMNASTRTNNTNKWFRYSQSQYTNAYQPFLAIMTGSTNTENGVYFGGGSAVQPNATALHFFTGTSSSTAGAAVERMTINSSGNIGINATSPSYLLEVSGTAKVAGTFTVGSATNSGTSASRDSTISLGGYNLARVQMSMQYEGGGWGNFFMGHGAGNATNTGSFNYTFGSYSLNSLTTGISNVGMGYGALGALTTGSGNTALGRDVASKLTTGSNNVMVGTSAGQYVSGSTSATTVNQSVAIGYLSKYLADGSTNEIVIGAQATGAGSNTATIGSTSITKTILNGSIGINTTTPTSRLHITEPDDSWNSSFRMDRSWESSTDYFQMMYDYEGLKIRTMDNDAAAAADIIFRPMNSEAMRITSAGAVGIGTTTPTTNLDIVESQNGDTTVNVRNVNTGTSARSGFTLTNSGTTYGAESGGLFLLGVNHTNGEKLQLFTNSGIASGVEILATATHAPVVISTQATERMRVASSGNVGIGTSNPAYKLEVNGGARLVGSNGADLWTERSDSDIDIRGTNSTRGRTFSIHASASNTDVVNFYANNAGSFVQAMAIKNVTGYVGILNSAAAYPLDVGGSVNLAAGAALRFGGSTVVCTSAGCTASSDRRLKENIKPLDFSLEKLLSLNAVQYDWKDKAKFGAQHEIGFIAQDLEKVYPEVVRTDKESGYKSVSYDKLVAPILEALKVFNARILKLFDRTEQHAREIASIKEENAELKSRVEKTEQENKELKERLDRIEKALTNSNSK